MAVDMFLKLEGISGESKDKIHPGEIDILSWSWGGSNNVSMGGGGLGSGKATMTPMTLSKYVDISSPSLLLAMLKGVHIQTGTLTIRKAGANPLEYLVYNFTEIFINSINNSATNATAGADRLVENISISFNVFQMVYKEQSATGAAAGTSRAAWDFSKNTQA